MKITEVIIIAAILGLVLYDVAAVLLGGNKSSISYVLYKAGKRYPIIGVVAGGLLAHLFWRIEK